jgi:glycosyltransferase involved in cell wall biosynthesis
LKLLLVGDGPLRPSLERRAREAGLADRIVFAGLVPPGEVPALLGLMDVVVHLSRREGLPRALSQALAAGRPVVALDCDGAGEVCRSDETGFLLPPGDARGMIDRLVQLADEPELRRRLGENGRKFVRANFSVERMVDELHALYLRLAAERIPANPGQNPPRA